MNWKSKRTVAIGAAVAVAALGGGVAVAATSGSDPRDEILADAAQRLDVSPQELRSALQGAFEDQLDDAVRAGRLTQEQADRMKERLTERGLPLGGPGGPGGPGRPGGPGLHRHGGPIGPGLDAAADYFGLTRGQLARRLMNGRSLAQIARAEGKSVDGLQGAIVEAAAEQLDRAVDDGRLSDRQRDEMLERLRQRVDELVDARGPRGPRGKHRGHGPGGGFGGLGGPGGPPPSHD